MLTPLKTTQYGLSVKAGGWDPDGDSGTDQWQGDVGNILNLSSCALTVSAEDELARSLLIPGTPAPAGRLHLPQGQLLKVTFPGAPHIVLYRTFDDRAPEADGRLDIFNPYAFDHVIPDTGEVEVVLLR